MYSTEEKMKEYEALCLGLTIPWYQSNCAPRARRR